MGADTTKEVRVALTPASASTEVTFTSSDTDVVTVEKIDNRAVRLTGVASGTATITATAGNLSAKVEVTVS